jgi:hypothetical protein
MVGRAAKRNYRVDLNLVSRRDYPQSGRCYT